MQNIIAEVKLSNAESIKLKAARKQEELRLEQEVLEYNRKKILAEEAAAREAKRLADEKEKEIQRLREAQEKAADRQAEIDQLRAKRAHEQHERDYRAAELERIRKAAEVKQALDVARQEQFATKGRLLIQQADASRIEFSNIVKQQKLDEERERQLEAEKKEALLRHKKTIQLQISKNEQVAKQMRLDYLEDGKKQREKI